MLQEYIRELEQIKLLSQEQEQSLWHAYSQGCITSRNKILTAYQPLVFKTALSFRLGDNVTLELVQEGNIALIECADRYDYTKGVAFSLYALHRIRGQMYDYLKANSFNMAQLQNIDLDIKDESKSPQVLMEDNYIYTELKNALMRLPSKEQVVLEGIYLQDKDVKTLAAGIEVSQAYVYKLHNKGIRRVRGMLAKIWHNFK